jgi:hypothetical protein
MDTSVRPFGAALGEPLANTPEGQILLALRAATTEPEVGGVEAVKQRFLRHRPLAHHRLLSVAMQRLNQDFTTTSRPSFSTQSGGERTGGFRA